MSERYLCQRCTACCRWPGQVRLSETDISRLAAFLRMAEHNFIQSYTRLMQNRRGLALQEVATGDCIFLHQNSCTVQPVKPLQCRDFPNRWNFPGFTDRCQAKPVHFPNQKTTRWADEEKD
jgi:Fe-S-cluster containining protein